MTHPLLSPITDASFQAEVIDAPGPVAVEFMATWCVPSKAIAGVIEELAQAYEKRVRFVTVDVDTEAQTCRAHAIRNVPSVVVFNNGEALGRIIGAATKEKIAAFIDAKLKAQAEQAIRIE